MPGPTRRRRRQWPTTACPPVGPYPAVSQPRTLAAVGKRRVNAVTLTSHFFLNRSRQIRECLSTCQLVQNVGLFLSRFRTYCQYLSGWHFLPTRTPRGKGEAGGHQEGGLPPSACLAGSQLVVAARADKRTPGSPGQGRRTRGSTQRVATAALSVRLHARGQPETWPVPFIGPLAPGAIILTHPGFRQPPRAQGRGRGASDMSPVGRRGVWPVAPRLPSASLVIS